nr:AsmA-like C-terminal domain-containing protein [uncultured Helicobacter sp.]
MMKKRSKHIVSIVVFLGILLTLSLMGYKTLSNGIYSPHISFGQIQIEGLYLRLNNKLVLNIEKLDISALQKQDKQKTDDTPLDPQDILGWIKKFLFVISYFEKLDIENVVFADEQKRSVHYDGHEYRINAPEFFAYFDVEESNKDTELLIHELEILSLGLQVQGKFVYQSLKKTLEMDIAISPKEPIKQPTPKPKKPKAPNQISDTQTSDEEVEPPLEQPTLYVRGITDFYKIDLEASTSHLYNLDTIKPYVEKLKIQALNDWLFKNIKYDVLKLHSLRFQSTLDGQFFAKLQKTLALDLAIEAPKVYLASNIKPIEATRIILYMRDENLTFLLKDPFFTNIKLDGSEVKISNVFTPPLSVKIAIRSQNAMMSDDLNDLLQVYGVSVPLRSADSKLRVNLDIGIENKNKHTQVSLNGNINAPQTTLNLGSFPLVVNNLNLNLTNTPEKAYIQILNTKANYANSVKGTLNAMWNLKSSKLQADLAIDTFTLTSQALSQNSTPPVIPKESDELTKRIIQAIYAESQKGFSEAILKINPKQMPKITIDGELGGKDKIISLPDFALKIHIKDKANEFELGDIAKIYPYSPILQYFGIPSGNLKLQSSDFESFILSGEVSNLKYPLYDKDAKKLSRYFLEGVIDSKGIRINSKNKKFSFIKEGNVSKILLDGYNLRIDEVFSSKIPILAELNQESESKEKLTPAQRAEQEAFIKAKQQYEREHKISPYITYLEAKDMDFYLNNYIIPSDVASVSIRDGVIRADVTYGNGVANVDMAYSRAKLRLSNFSAAFLNRVWGRDIFQGGLFNFKGIYDEGALKGEITMQNTIYKDLAIVQNVLALIDTIPALLTFRKPGLGVEGYEVKNGRVDFVINDQFLVLENIDLVGSSIDVEGGGLVNLKNQALDIVLKASTLKTLASIIDKIPLVDYVILGSDGKFTTGIVMKGTLEKPKSEVSVAKDILLSPFEMVGRILEPVDNLLSGLTEAIDKSVTPQKPKDLQTQQNTQDSNLNPKMEEEGQNTTDAKQEESEDSNDENIEPNLPQQEPKEDE